MLSLARPKKEYTVDVPAAPAAPRPSDISATLAGLVGGYGIEIGFETPDALPEPCALLPPGTAAYIPCLPGREPAEVARLAAWARRAGLEPVPHVAARNFAGPAQVEEYLARVSAEAGVTQALVIAGSQPRPRGPYHDSMQLLATGAFERHGFRALGVAGHPENEVDGHMAALRWKVAYARAHGLRLHIVTQFCFEPAPFIAYHRRLLAEGFDVPLHLGIAGLCSFKTLLRYGISCGVGPSLRFVQRRATRIGTLLRMHSPQPLMIGIARHLAATPQPGIVKAHFFPFGGLAKTAAWANAAAEGRLDPGAAQARPDPGSSA
jgi:methylenetetrahydrofolate reductase (NADPH)